MEGKTLQDSSKINDFSTRISTAKLQDTSGQTITHDANSTTTLRFQQKARAETNTVQLSNSRRAVTELIAIRAAKEAADQPADQSPPR